MTTGRAIDSHAAKRCPVCKKPCDKLYGSEGKYVARCFECWKHPHPDDWSPA